MRKLLVVLFAITLVAGCVSNRTFKAEKQRIGRIEFQQMKDIENLDQLREDYELNQQSIEKMLTDLDDELVYLKEDLVAMNKSVAEIRSEFADYANLSDAQIKDLSARLSQTTDKMNQTETRITQINDQISEINSVTEAQKAEFAEIKENYDSAITFNEDALIDLDQRLEALRTSVATSQEKLDAIDSKYSKYATDNQTGVEGGKPVDPNAAGRIAELEQKITNDRAGMSEIIGIISELEGDINNLQKMIRETTDNTLATVDADLAANKEETAAKLSEMDKKLNDMKYALNNGVNGEITTVRKNVNKVASELIVVANDLEAVTSKTATGKAKTDKAYNSYYNAKAYYDKGKYEEAIVKLEAFTVAYPDHELTPNAYYWIAESYYAGKNYEKAMRQFQYVADNFTQSHKAKDAQIKIAMCHANLGDVAMAKSELGEFKTAHPDYTNMKLVDKLIKGYK